MWLVTLAWQRAVATVLRPYDLTHAQFVLLAGAWWLAREEGPPTQRRLVAHTGTDEMMTSQVLRRLERKELVLRLVDELDGRARRIVLTDAGAELLDAVMPEVDRTDAEFFAPVRTDQLLEILTVLALAQEQTA